MDIRSQNVCNIMAHARPLSRSREVLYLLLRAGSALFSKAALAFAMKVSLRGPELFSRYTHHIYEALVMIWSK